MRYTIRVPTALRDEDEDIEYVRTEMSAYFDVPARVSVYRPIPADRDLRVEWFESAALLCDGDAVVAYAEPATKAA